MNPIIAIVVVLFAFFIVDSNIAKADNLLCNDNGRIQIYIQTKDIEVDIDDKFKALGAIGVAGVNVDGASMFYVALHPHSRFASDWTFNAGIPCIRIDEEIGVTTSLQRYLKLIGSLPLKE